MTTLLIIIHVTVCLFLIAIVLLQHGKGADIGATFGGSSQTLFGSEGPLPLLNKITTFSAIIFMGTSVSLAYLSANKSTGSVMTKLTQEAVAPSKKEVPVMIPAPQEKPAAEAKVQEKPTGAAPLAVQPAVPTAEKTAEPVAPAAQQAALPAAEAPATIPAQQEKPTEAAPAQPAEKKAE